MFSILSCTCSAFLLGSFVTLALPAVSSAASESKTIAMLSDSKTIRMLKEKLDKVEKNQAELYHSLEEKKSPGLMSKVTDKITLGGIIELEASIDSNDKDGDTSDIVLATASLGVEADINEHVSGVITLLYEEDDTPLEVDEGTITVTSPSNFSATGGKFYIPFGVYNSHFVSDPVTLKLGETNESAAMVSYAKEGLPLEFSAGIFNGAMDETGDKNKIDDFFASITATPIEGLTVGVYYLSDFAETARMEALVATRTKTVAGQGAFFYYEYNKLSFIGEYITAAEEYNVADLDANSDGVGDEPSAYDLEIAYHYNDAAEIALRLEGSSDFFDWPQRQYGVAVGYGIYENVALAFEVLTGEFDASDVKRTLATAQIAIEF